MPGAEYTIRPFASTEDYRACVELQEDTWGAGFSERVSPAILKVSQILGGVASGAYDEGGRLVGFVDDSGMDGWCTGPTCSPSAPRRGTAAWVGD